MNWGFSPRKLVVGKMVDLSHIDLGRVDMTMSVQMQEAWDWAEDYEKTLEGSDPRLRGCVIVQHEDGTSMMLPWAYAVRYCPVPEDGTLQYETYVIVFTEHHGKQIFAESELTGLVAWGGPPNFDPEPVGPFADEYEIPYG